MKAHLFCQLALFAALLATCPCASDAQSATSSSDYPAWEAVLVSIKSAKSLNEVGQAVEAACKDQHEAVAMLALTLPYSQVRCAAARGAKLFSPDRQASFVRAALLLDSMWDGAKPASGEWKPDRRPGDLLEEFQADLLGMIRGLLRDPQAKLDFLVAAERKETLARLNAFVPPSSQRPGAKEMAAALADERTRPPQAVRIVELASKLQYEEVILAAVSSQKSPNLRIAAVLQGTDLNPGLRARVLRSVLANDALWARHGDAWGTNSDGQEEFEKAVVKLLQAQMGQPTINPSLREASERQQWSNQLAASAQ